MNVWPIGIDSSPSAEVMRNFPVAQWRMIRNVVSLLVCKVASLISSCGEKVGEKESPAVVILPILRRILKLKNIVYLHTVLLCLV